MKQGNIEAKLEDKQAIFRINEGDIIVNINTAVTSKLEEQVVLNTERNKVHVLRHSISL